MKDIKTMIKETTLEETKGLSPNHRALFEQKLNSAMAPKKNYSTLWKVAAMVVLFLGFGAVSVFSPKLDEYPKSTYVDEASTAITLGDLSPAFKKIESFYLASIQHQLNMIDTTSDHELVRNYMNRLDVLNNDYLLLNKELNESGPNEANVNALIDNLKLRLELLFKLKNKLKELKLN